MKKQLVLILFGIAGLLYVGSAFLTDDLLLGAILGIGGVLVGVTTFIAGELVELNAKK